MTDPIKHVVMLMLENNSFDRMLGCTNAIHGDLEGVDLGNPFSNPDYPDTSHQVQQLPNDLTSISSDPWHDLHDVSVQIGNHDCQGFVTNFAHRYPRAPQGERDQVMGYFALNDLPVLHTLARHFLVCDQCFSSVPGPTWPNRFFVHSGTSLGHVDMPEGIAHPAFHLYNQPTVFQRLSDRQKSWRIYYGDVPQSLVMTQQLGHPLSYKKMDQFAQDALVEASFPDYVFIEPSYFGANQNDQHPPTDVAHGEILIAQVYNALRQNEALWQSTLLVLLYDEHGGFCDHIPPPSTVAPDANTKDFAFTQLGLRVPAILISPWVDAGVLHTQFDHTSLLKYLTDKWGLEALGNRTAQAESFASALRSTIRTDCPLSIPIPAARPNAMNVVMNGHQMALAAFTQHLEVTSDASDGSIASHARAMASGYAAQCQAVSERVDEFFQKATAVEKTKQAGN